MSSCSTSRCHLIRRRRGFRCRNQQDQCFGSRRPYRPPAHRAGNRVRERVGCMFVVPIFVAAASSDSPPGTTDAIFLEKPQLYDLIIDLTIPSSPRSIRPSLLVSRPYRTTNTGKPIYRLQSVRFTWSDFKLWAELEALVRETKMASTIIAVHHWPWPQDRWSSALD
jgi:hypothetical protein